MNERDDRPTIEVGNPPEPPTLNDRPPHGEPTTQPTPFESGPRGSAETQIIGGAAPSFAWLIIRTGARAGRIFRLNPGGTSVGRDAQNDIILDDPAISRQHAKLRKDGKGDKARYLISDLATPNGISVNGRKIAKETLADGDEIQLGQTVLVFKEIK